MLKVRSSGRRVRKEVAVAKRWKPLEAKERPLLPFEPRPSPVLPTTSFPFLEVFSRSYLPLLFPMEVIAAQIAHLQQESARQAALIQAQGTTILSLSSTIARLSSENRSKDIFIRRVEDKLFPAGFWVWEKDEEGSETGHWVFSKVRVDRSSHPSSSLAPSFESHEPRLTPAYSYLFCRISIENFLSPSLQNLLPPSTPYPTKSSNRSSSLSASARPLSPVSPTPLVGS